MKKVLIVGGCVLALVLAAYMLSRSQAAPKQDPSADAAAAKATKEIEAANSTDVTSATEQKSKADRMKSGK